MTMNEYEYEYEYDYCCVAIKSNLRKQVIGWIWPVVCSFLAPVLNCMFGRPNLSRPE